MSLEIQKRIEKLFLMQGSLISQRGELVKVSDIVFMQYEKGHVVAVTETKLRLLLPENLNYYAELLKGMFIRVHRSYLVALGRIEGTHERFPAESVYEVSDEATRRAKADECELSLLGSSERVPVTSTYGKAVKKALGISSFHYLSPEHPDDKRLRLYGLIDFGWRELYNLDARDAAAVEAFKSRWDIRKFSRERMLSYFRMFGVNEVNKKRMIKNIIYQIWRWIMAGIEEENDGNIRSMWYQIKAVLAHHANVLTSGDITTFYSTLLEMIEREGLFRYKDFGFMDMNEPYREIGSRRPEVVLASEKIGHYVFIRRLAREFGVSFICMKGEPAVISMEYFSDDLHASCGRAPLTVFCISDIDPAGYSIENNLIKRLEYNGHEVKRLVKLVDLDIFEAEDVEVLRFPVVSFEKKGSVIKPVAPALMGQVTKALNWFEEIQDSRLVTERDKGGGWKVVTIWGVESDAADRKNIEQRFKDGLERLAFG